jgi:hypothetical protein
VNGKNNDGKMNDQKGKETNQSKVTDCKSTREMKEEIEWLAT